MTTRLARHLREHDAGQSRSTKAGAPWRLVWKEAFTNSLSARRREKELKTSRGKAWLRRQM
jgi:putative endonuclease